MRRISSIQRLSCVAFLTVVAGCSIHTRTTFSAGFTGQEIVKTKDGTELAIDAEIETPLFERILPPVFEWAASLVGPFLVP